MKLYISQADIDAGEPCMASKCALAVAFTRATGLKCQAGHDGVWVLDPRVHGDMSQEGSRFISLFDCDKRFCSPAVVEILFSESAPEILRKDYVPDTDLGGMIKELRIQGRELPRVCVTH